MGRNWLRVLRANPRFEVVAVVDPVAPEATDKKWPTCVATPTDRHQSAIVTVMNGAHALIEKPLAPTFGQCVSLIRAANECGGHLAVGHVERFNPAVVALQETILPGDIGAPVHVDATRIGPRPASVAPGNNVSIDLAVHDVDLAALLLGPLRALGCSHSSDDCVRYFESLGGARAAVHASWLSETKERSIHVIGTDGTLHADLIAQTLQVGGYPEPMRLARAEPLALEAEAFADLIETGNYGRLATGLEAATAVALVT